MLLPTVSWLAARLNTQSGQNRHPHHAQHMLQSVAGDSGTRNVDICIRDVDLSSEQGTTVQIANSDMERFWRLVNTDVRETLQPRLPELRPSACEAMISGLQKL